MHQNYRAATNTFIDALKKSISKKTFSIFDINHLSENLILCAQIPDESCTDSYSNLLKKNSVETLVIMVTCLHIKGSLSLTRPIIKYGKRITRASQQSQNSYYNIKLERRVDWIACDCAITTRIILYHQWLHCWIMKKAICDVTRVGQYSRCKLFGLVQNRVHDQPWIVSTLLRHYISAIVMTLRSINPTHHPYSFTNKPADKIDDFYLATWLSRNLLSCSRRSMETRSLRNSSNSSLPSINSFIPLAVSLTLWSVTLSCAKLYVLIFSFLKDITLFSVHSNYI